MSVRAIAWAFETEIPSRSRTNPSTAKLVLVALADRADEDGYCWPSVPTLARKCQLGERTVQRLLKYLQTIGLVSIERQKLERSGAQTTNRYRLALSIQTKLPLETPTRRPAGASVTPGGDAGLAPAPRHAGTGPVPAATVPIRNNPSRDPSPDPGRPLAASSNGGGMKKHELTDEEFLEELRANPIYSGIDIALELGKLDAWLLTPRGYGKKKTRGRIVRWLNKEASDRKEVSAVVFGGTCENRVSQAGSHFMKPCGRPIAPERVNPKKLKRCVECLAERTRIDQRLGISR